MPLRFGRLLAVSPDSCCRLDPSRPRPLGPPLALKTGEPTGVAITMLALLPELTAEPDVKL